MSHRQRGGERAAVDVRHQDAGDRQDGVLGDGLRPGHGIDRRVVDGHDPDKRDRGLAVVYSVIDDNCDDAVSRNRSVASRAEADRLQRSLVVGKQSDPGERQDFGDRVVAGSGDTAPATTGWPSADRRLRVRQRDGCRSDIRAAEIRDNADFGSTDIASATITLTNRKLGDLLTATSSLPPGITASSFDPCSRNPDALRGRFVCQLRDCAGGDPLQRS